MRLGCRALRPRERTIGPRGERLDVETGAPSGRGADIEPLMQQALDRSVAGRLAEVFHSARLAAFIAHII